MVSTTIFCLKLKVSDQVNLPQSDLPVLRVTVQAGFPFANRLERVLCAMPDIYCLVTFELVRRRRRERFQPLQSNRRAGRQIPEAGGLPILCPIGPPQTVDLRMKKAEPSYWFGSV